MDLCIMYATGFIGPAKECVVGADGTTTDLPQKYPGSADRVHEGG
jgi:hypothetical protein